MLGYVIKLRSYIYILYIIYIVCVYVNTYIYREREIEGLRQIFHTRYLDRNHTSSARPADGGEETTGSAFFEPEGMVCMYLTMCVGRYVCMYACKNLHIHALLYFFSYLVIRVLVCSLPYMYVNRMQTRTPKHL